MGIVYVFNFGSICIYGKEFLRKFTFHQKYRKDLTLKQMFAISAKLRTEQSDDIMEWFQQIGNTLNVGIYLRWVLKKSSVSRTRRFTNFHDLCYTWKDEQESTTLYCLEEKLTWFKSSSQYRALDTVDCEPMEFEWNLFQGFTTLQLRYKVQEFLLRLGETPDNFYRTNYHVDDQ